MIGIKKTSSIKNKFFDNKTATRIEEKIPHDIDLEMEIEEEKETVDYEMQIDEDFPQGIDMEIDNGEIDRQEDQISEETDAKNKRADRRKTILKELEVCDLLDLRNP